MVAVRYKAGRGGIALATASRRVVQMQPMEVRMMDRVVKMV